MPIIAASIAAVATVGTGLLMYHGNQSAADEANRNSSIINQMQLADAREARAMEEAQFQRTHALAEKSERRIGADTNFDNYRSLINSSFNMALNNKEQGRKLMEFSQSRIRR